MFVIVARSGTESILTPSPVYSMTLPTPPLTASMESTFKMMSLALTPFERAPVRRTSTTRGMFSMNGSPAIAHATSRPPAPIASMPMPPPVGVCESLPRSVAPGLPKRSRCT